MIRATDISYYNASALIFQKYLVALLKAITWHGIATTVYKNVSL